MATQVDALVLSKSLALVEKTKRRVAQIDTAAFPTTSSEIARGLLLAAIESLGNKAFWQAMNPEALYHALIQIQSLVEGVETSTSDHISWPLVSYCDHFWKLLFPKGDVQIFYSVFAEHNYGISSFTHRLRLLLENVLPPAEIVRILGSQHLYCLQIASLEDENLPLYANIGHEFGHALYWAKEQELLAIFLAECNTTITAISAELVATNATLSNRRALRMVWALKSIATELFCDLVGAMIAGPAFLLSLYEMGWGTDQNSWSTKLSLKDSNIRAYPSFAFRLGCVKKLLPLVKFADELKTKLESLPDTIGDELQAKLESLPGKIPGELQEKLTSLRDRKKALNKVGEHVTGIPDNHTADHTSVRPAGDGDASAIQQALEKKLPELRQSLETFVRRCSAETLSSLQNQPEFAAVSGIHVFELIRRLDADILPNIIPDDTDPLLGIPATFATILNASALFRMHVLSTRDGNLGTEEINRQVQKVERLTAKAFEVSYIQHEFNAWKPQKPA